MKMKLFTSTVTAMEMLRKILCDYMKDDVWFVQYDTETKSNRSREKDLVEVNIEAQFVCPTKEDINVYLVTTRMLLIRDKFWFVSGQEGVLFRIKNLSESPEEPCESGYAIISRSSHPWQDKITVKKCAGMHT